MKEKAKPQNNTTAKIILIISGIIILAFLLTIGSCVYKIIKNPKTSEFIKSMNATDAEIAEFGTYLNMNEESKFQDTKQYEGLIPQEVKEMKFANHAEASKAYYDLYASKDWSSLGEEEQKLGQAYKAYGDYYAAVSARLSFTNIVNSSNAASRAMVKAMMNSDVTFMEMKEIERRTLQGENSGVRGDDKNAHQPQGQN